MLRSQLGQGGERRAQRAGASRARGPRGNGTPRGYLSCYAGHRVRRRSGWVSAGLTANGTGILTIIMIGDTASAPVQVDARAPPGRSHSVSIRVTMASAARQRSSVAREWTDDAVTP